MFEGEKTDLVTDACGGAATIWLVRLLTRWEGRGLLVLLSAGDKEQLVAPCAPEAHSELHQ